MKNDYITRERAHNMVSWLTRYVNKEIRDQHGVNEMVDYDEVQAGLDRIPAANVARDEHGEWLDLDDDYGVLTCSVCDERSPLDYRWNFCPCCGADMQEE